MNSPDCSHTGALTNKIALITGGGRGIGRSAALHCARAGAHVVVVARSEKQIAETGAAVQAEGGKATAIPLDITDKDRVAQLHSVVSETIGPVDILVNNAATSEPLGPILETDADEWWHCMDVNVRGALLCIQTFVPAMVSRGSGCVINVASESGILPYPFASAYITSKTALIRLSEVLALETGYSGVKVFCIEPGTVRTAMSEKSIQSPMIQLMAPWFKKIFDEHRDVPPDRAARRIVELASGKADALSGAFLYVRDNLDELIERADTTPQADFRTLRIKE